MLWSRATQAAKLSEQSLRSGHQKWSLAFHPMLPTCFVKIKALSQLLSACWLCYGYKLVLKQILKSNVIKLVVELMNSCTQRSHRTILKSLFHAKRHMIRPISALWGKKKGAWTPVHWSPITIKEFLNGAPHPSSQKSSRSFVFPQMEVSTFQVARQARKASPDSEIIFLAGRFPIMI